MKSLMMNSIMWLAALQTMNYFVGMAFEWAKPGLKILVNTICFIGLFVLVPAIYDEYPIMAIALGFLPIAIYINKKETIKRTYSSDGDADFNSAFIAFLGITVFSAIFMAIFGGVFLGMREIVLLDFIKHWTVNIDYVAIIGFDLSGILIFLLTKKL